MADLYSTVWPAFLQETEEQLAEVEWILLHNIKDLSRLFRSYHTLKGSFTAANFKHLAALAHCCEDVLNVCRQHQLSLDDSSIVLLQEASEFFRTAFKQIEYEQSEPVPAVELQNKLKQHACQLASINLSHNDDALLKAFESTLPALALSLKANAQLQYLPSLLQDLEQIAVERGYCVLAHHLAEIIALAQKNVSYQTESLQQHIAVCFEQIDEISEQLNLPLSLNNATSLARPLLREAWHQLFQGYRAEDDFVALSANALLALLSKLEVMLALLGSFDLQKQLRYFSFVLRKLYDRSDAEKSVFYSCLACSLNCIKDFNTVCSPEKGAILEKQIALLQQSLFEQGQTLASHTFKKERLFDYEISPTVLEGLSQQQWQMLAEAKKKGLYSHELDFDFTQQKTAENVLQLLQNDAQIVHSSTLYKNKGKEQYTCIRFLCVSSLSMEVLRQRLLQADPYHVVLLPHSVGGNAKTEESFAAVHELREDTVKSLRTIKVESHAIDKLIDQVAMLKIECSRLVYCLEKNLPVPNTLTASMRANSYFTWQAQLERLQQSIQSVQESGLRLRVIRLELALQRFYHFVRQTAGQLEKQVRFELIGGETLIDKSLVDKLAEPLAHLIRNAIDHGIEPSHIRKQLNKPIEGLIELVAQEQQGKLFITVRDDGAGLDAEVIYQRALELGMLQRGLQYTQEEILQQIFYPGFSLAKRVNHYSGRGVGMDAVKNSIVSAGGNIRVVSEKGQGVQIQIYLPVSAAIQKVLLIRQSGHLYAFPETWIQQILANDRSESGQLLFDGQMLPIYYLAELFQLEKNSAAAELLVLQYENRRVAIAVESIVGHAEVLLKEQQNYLQDILGVAGASVLADGSIALIIDALGLFQLAFGEHDKSKQR